MNVQYLDEKKKIDEQNTDISSKRQEFDTLKSEEIKLESKLTLTKSDAEQVAQGVTDTQLEISQLKTKSVELEEYERRVNDMISDYDQSIRNNDIIRIASLLPRSITPPPFLDADTTLDDIKADFTDPFAGEDPFKGEKAVVLLNALGLIINLFLLALIKKTIPRQSADGKPTLKLSPAILSQQMSTIHSVQKVQRQHCHLKKGSLLRPDLLRPKRPLSQCQPMPVQTKLHYEPHRFLPTKAKTILIRSEQIAIPPTTIMIHSDRRRLAQIVSKASQTLPISIEHSPLSFFLSFPFYVNIRFLARE